MRNGEFYERVLKKLKDEKNPINKLQVQSFPYTLIISILIQGDLLDEPKNVKLIMSDVLSGSTRVLFDFGHVC